MIHERRRDVRRTTTFLGINLRSQRSVSLLLLLSTLCIGFVLTTRYHLINSEQINRRIGWQSQAQAFRARKIPAPAPASAVAQQPKTTTTYPDQNDGESSMSGLGDGFAAWKPTGSWNPLVRDERPITEIQLISCVIPPMMGNLCQPKTTKAEILLKGEWIRVERDLNARVGIYFLFLFERRLLPGSTLPVVTNITLLTHSPTSKDLASDRGIWVAVSENLRSGLQFPKLDRMTLHYHLTPQADVLAARRASITSTAGELEPITELDVVYGDAKANPLRGFTKVPGMITGGDDDASTSRIGSAIAVRRALPPVIPTPSLQFSPSGDFRILQVADLHFSTGAGACRDMSSPQKEACEKMGADQYSLEWLERAITKTKPDMIVLTGDQSNGQDTSWSVQTSIMKWAPLVIAAKIPWTAIFGNHDSEVGSTRAEQMELMMSMPYFVGEAGPEAVDGVGNYVRSIRSGDSNNATLFNLYFLDSHANTKTFGIFNSAGYDYIKPNQINWYRSESSKVRPLLRPYSSSSSPSSSSLASMSDLDRKRRRRAQKVGNDLVVGMMPDDGSNVRGSTKGYNDGFAAEFEAMKKNHSIPSVLPVGPTTKAPLKAKPNAITFMHIPLIETYDSAIDIGSDGKPLTSGEKLEGGGSSKTNSGFFEQAILSQKELLPAATSSSSDSVKVMDEFWDGESEQTNGRSETKLIVYGHCHITDECRRVQGVWMCFGGGSSFSGYGKEGFERRMSVYEISQFGETIETYKLLDSMKKVGDLRLVGEGARV